jgi:predicted membrane protein
MKRQFWGAVFTILGILVLLETLGIMDLRLEFWPVMVALGGLTILWSSFRNTNWFGLALGLWVSAIGVFSILDNYEGLVPVTGGDIARGGWPLLLVALGVSMVFGKSSWRFVHKSDWKGKGWKGGSKVVGEYRVGQGGTWHLNNDLKMEHGVGDFRLDLTTADITPGVHRIDVHAGIGDVVIRVPDNVSVTAAGKVGIGDLEVLNEHRSGIGCEAQSRIVVPESTVELIIEAKLGLGDLNIVRRPAVKVIS